MIVHAYATGTTDKLLKPIGMDLPLNLRATSASATPSTADANNPQEPSQSEARQSPYGWRCSWPV